MVEEEEKRFEERFKSSKAVNSNKSSGKVTKLLP